MPINPRYAARIVAIGMALLAMVIAAHLFEPPLVSRTAHSLIRSFHAPGFAIVTIVLIRLLDRTPTRRARYLLAPIGALLAGIASELAQLTSARDASWQDVLTDMVGIGAGLDFFMLSPHGSVPMLSGRSASLELDACRHMGIDYTEILEPDNKKLLKKCWSRCRPGLTPALVSALPIRVRVAIEEGHLETFT